MDEEDFRIAFSQIRPAVALEHEFIDTSILQPERIASSPVLRLVVKDFTEVYGILSYTDNLALRLDVEDFTEFNHTSEVVKDVGNEINAPWTI